MWVAVGGRGTLLGPIIGAIFINYLQSILSGFFLKFWLIIMGAVLLLTIMLFPGGIMGFVFRQIVGNDILIVINEKSEPSSELIRIQSKMGRIES